MNALWLARDAPGTAASSAAALRLSVAEVRGGQAQRQFGGGAHRGHGGAFDGQPGDGLAVRVEQPRDAARADRADHRQQRSRTDQHHDQVPDRPGGQILSRTARRPAGHRLLRLRRAVRLAQQQPTAPPGLLQLKHQPGPVQPPVEGVQPGKPPGAAAGYAALGGHRERRRQGGQRGGQEILGQLLAGVFAGALVVASGWL
jgi:hypothetical protein